MKGRVRECVARAVARNQTTQMFRLMKKKLTIIVSSLAIAGALSLAIPSVFAQQTNRPLAGARVVERHPAIRAAIASLEKAKIEMQHAAHDFGGHRAAALAECDKAIEQLREALKYDQQ